MISGETIKMIFFFNLESDSFTTKISKASVKSSLCKQSVSFCLQAVAGTKREKCVRKMREILNGAIPGHGHNPVP